MIKKELRKPLINNNTHQEQRHTPLYLTLSDEPSNRNTLLEALKIEALVVHLLSQDTVFIQTLALTCKSAKKAIDNVIKKPHFRQFLKTQNENN